MQFLFYYNSIFILLWFLFFFSSPFFIIFVKKILFFFPLPWKQKQSFGSSYGRTSGFLLKNLFTLSHSYSRFMGWAGFFNVLREEGRSLSVNCSNLPLLPLFKLILLSSLCRNITRLSIVCVNTVLQNEHKYIRQHRIKKIIFFSYLYFLLLLFRIFEK